MDVHNTNVEGIFSVTPTHSLDFSESVGCMFTLGPRDVRVRGPIQDREQQRKTRVSGTQTPVSSGWMKGTWGSGSICLRTSEGPGT